MRRSFTRLLATALLAGVSVAKVVEYTWDISWVYAAPDGTTRAVIGVNNAWPCPEIRARKGDTVRVNLTNSLGNQTTGLHFHGINQISTNWMDGPSLVTQCPVAPGDSIVYEFEVSPTPRHDLCPWKTTILIMVALQADEAGTFWCKLLCCFRDDGVSEWVLTSLPGHSHNLGQYPDGLRGPMIIEDPEDPYKNHYDEEYVLTLTDWQGLLFLNVRIVDIVLTYVSRYHNDSMSLVQKFLNPKNPLGIPPIPNGMLLNEGQGSEYPMDPYKRYRFRIISVAAFASFMIHFDSHPMYIIMNDAAYIKKKGVYQLRIAPAQRFDVIIGGCRGGRHRTNYPFLVSLDQNADWTNHTKPLGFPHNATGHLIMDPTGERKEHKAVAKWSPHNDAHLKPLRDCDILPESTTIFEFNFETCSDEFGIHRYVGSRKPEMGKGETPETCRR